MKVLLSWLREFAPIEGDPQWLGDQLSALGLAVEDIEIIGGGLEVQGARLGDHGDPARV